MNDLLRYYELQTVERMEELQREADHDRLLAELPRNASFWRRGVRLVGRTLITIGTRLEQDDSSEQTVVYS